MKKLFTIVAALMLAVSAFADKIYFKTTSACDWSVDNAKIGAVFRTGMTTDSYGLFTEFFTAVEGVSGLFEAEVPSNEEPWVSVQFLRYDPTTTATKPYWGDFWNKTGVEAYDGTDNMFTATSWGGAGGDTTGDWSVYTPGSDPEPIVPTGNYVYFQTTEDCNWASDGAKIGAVFRTAMSEEGYGLFTDYMATNGSGLFYAEIPANEEPWISVQFIRYNTESTTPGWANFWNTTGVMAWDAAKNLFTATSWGMGLDGTIGEWSTYVPTAAEEAEENAVNIYSSGKNIFVEFAGEANVFACNMAGAVVINTVADGGISFSVPAPGLYIVKAGDVTAKLYVY